eukprot:5760784-Amphidinium_carterae.3
MSGTRAGFLNTWVYGVSLQGSGVPVYAPWFTDGLVSSPDGSQGEGPVRVYQAGTLMQFASILRCRWVIGHNDVEAESNKRRGFEAHELRSGTLWLRCDDLWNSSSEDQPVRTSLRNSPLGIPIVIEVLTYSGKKSIHKLSPFLNCPITHVVPLAIHIPHNVMRPDLWDGSSEFLRTMESRPHIENTMD